MKKTNPNLKLSIIKSLKKDPDKLLSELTRQCTDQNNNHILKPGLDEIARLLEAEASIQEERKTLSRKIGPAKKNNEDCTALIDQVAQLSSQIDELNAEIESQTARIESALGSDDSLPTDESSKLPSHLCPVISSDEAHISNSQPAEYTTSHSTTTDDTEWQSFVKQSAHATIYHDVRWQHIINNNFNHDLHHITCHDQDSKLKGILPLVHLKSKVFGSFTISMPYFNYGGPLASTPVVEQELLAYATNLSDELGCSHMEIRETHDRPEWKSLQRKVSMILPLPSSDEQLDTQLGSKVRAQVNKAKSNELSIKFGGGELLNHFYKVFSHNMRDLGTPVYGKQFFADIIESFPDHAFIAIVYQENKPLAAGFLLGYRDKLEIPWASSIRSKNHLGANMFMYRSILADAISRNYQFFDFGRSTRDASTYKFKKQWGAKEHPLHWHYWTKNNEGIPEINPDNPKYKIVIKVWQLLPVFATRLIGPLIARNLP